MGDISIIARRLSDKHVQYGWSGNGGYFSTVEVRLLAWYDTPEMVEYLFGLGQLRHLWEPHSEARNTWSAAGTAVRNSRPPVRRPRRRTIRSADSGRTAGPCAGASTTGCWSVRTKAGRTWEKSSSAPKRNPIPKHFYGEKRPQGPRGML